MPNFFVEGGRAPSYPPGQPLPPHEQRQVVQVVIREIPRPQMVPVPYYMAVVAEAPHQGAPTFNIEVLPNVPPLMVGAPVLYAFANCLGTVARKAMSEAVAWGWRPEPHPQSVIPVHQALQVPPKSSSEEPPMQTFIDHVKLLLTGAMEDVNVPPFMRSLASRGAADVNLLICA